MTRSRGSKGASGDPLEPLRKPAWLTEARRKAVHLSFILVPIAYLHDVLPWPSTRRQWSLVLLAAVVIAVGFNVLRLHHDRLRKAVGRLLGGLIRRHEHSNLLGSTYLLLASLLAIELFTRPVAAAAIGFCVLGDGVAALVGRAYGRPRIFGKSLEGAAAGFVACLVWAAYLGWGGHLPWAVVLGGALVASLVELLPIPLDDNLGVTLFSGYAMKLIGMAT